MSNENSINWNLRDLSSAIKISESAVLRFLRDGRNSAFLLKFRIANELNMSLVEGHNAPANLIAANGEIWKIKTCTKISGVSFCRNAMIGKGRKFNVSDFVEDLKDVTGFILCDLEGFPTVRIYKITSKDVQVLFNRGVIPEGRMKYSNFIAMT